MRLARRGGSWHARCRVRVFALAGGGRTTEEEMVMQGRSRRVVLTTLVTLLGLVLFGGMAIPPPASPPASPTHPLDEPLRLLGRARQAFAGVRDYSCTMI